MINKEPMGGTELQEKYLHKYVDSKLLSKVQICTSVPEKIPLHSIFFGKKILMIKKIYTLGFKKNLITTNMIGMFSTVIGLMKNIEHILIYPCINQ